MVANDEIEPKILSFADAQKEQNKVSLQVEMHPSRGQIYLEAPAEIDDLKLIYGIAEVLEKKLNDFGVYTFEQIMNWGETEVCEFSNLLETFQDRIHRDGWIYQATMLYNDKQKREAA